MVLHRRPRSTRGFIAVQLAWSVPASSRFEEGPTRVGLALVSSQRRTAPRRGWQHNYNTSHEATASRTRCFFGGSQGPFMFEVRVKMIEVRVTVNVSVTNVQKLRRLFFFLVVRNRSIVNSSASNNARTVAAIRFDSIRFGMVVFRGASHAN